MRFEQRIELGYRLRRSAWGQGLGTEGSRALLAYGFELLKLDSITAQTVARNFRSRNVLHKLGMHLESEFTYPEDLLPFWEKTERRAVRYTIERSTWLKRFGRGEP